MSAPDEQTPQRRRGTATHRICWLLIAFASLILGFASSASAQPDPRQMSGIPRPVTDLPNGSVSVRLIRGALTNNIANHPVELHVDSKVQTVNTDAEGRAQFDRLPAGATLKAVAVVDGERLESEEFPAPSQGAIRLLLVATDKNAPPPAAAAPSVPAVAGQVVIAGESRIVIEPGDESVSVFYILDIVNPGSAPVMPSVPFEFDLPDDMVGGAVLPGSSPQATSNGRHITVAGPFAPGKTSFEIGGSLPVSGPSLTFTQRFPANFEQPVFIAKKEGGLTVSSPQFSRVQDTTVEGTPVIIGAANAIAAGQSFAMTVSGLPYHSNTALIVTLGLSLAIGLLGLFFGSRPRDVETRAEESRRLNARREKLLQELTRLEQDHRRGKVDAARLTARREELIRALEAVYGALDQDYEAEGGTAPALSASRANA